MGQIWALTFLLVGIGLAWVFAALERALLTLAEARHLEDLEDENQLPVLSQAQVLHVFASRLGWLLGLFVMCWGWLQVSLPTYHALRDAWALSRTEASFALLWLPMAFIACGTLWLGHLAGQGRYKTLEKQPWLLFILFPFRLLAKPLQWLAQVLVQTKPDTTEVGLRALSGSPDAFWQMVQDQAGRDGDATNKQIFDKATELQSIRVRACMTNRTDIVAVDESVGIEGLRQAFLSSGYSKIPVFQEDLDHILGYCHSSSLFRKPKHIEDILSDIITVPESMTASQLLVEMNQAQKSMAVVIDEYGGTSGVVTMEDVMEEIFGEIEDELDEQTETELAESDHTWLLSARLEVDYLNDKYGWDLPTGDYESIGGLVVNLNQDLPEQGAIISAPPFVFEVVGMEETRITLLRLTLEA